MQPLLKVENLVKHYPARRSARSNDKLAALDGVCLSVPPQTTTALVGESGSGKSTLALCIACLESPTSGSIYLESKEITGLEEKELRSVRPQPQLVFQNP